MFLSFSQVFKNVQWEDLTTLLAFSKIKFNQQNARFRKLIWGRERLAIFQVTLLRDVQLFAIFFEMFVTQYTKLYHQFVLIP